MADANSSRNFVPTGRNEVQGVVTHAEPIHWG